MEILSFIGPQELGIFLIIIPLLLIVPIIALVDILRNEKPLFAGYWENKFGKYGRICTGREPVGEAEIHTHLFKDKS